MKMKEQEAELEGLSSLETFDKDKLLTVIDSVQVYSEERIEIVWKMNDGFFSEVAEKKNRLRYSKARNVIIEKTSWSLVLWCLFIW